MIRQKVCVERIDQWINVSNIVCSNVNTALVVKLIDHHVQIFRSPAQLLKPPKQKIRTYFAGLVTIINLFEDKQGLRCPITAHFCLTREDKALNITLKFGKIWIQKESVHFLGKIT